MTQEERAKSMGRAIFENLPQFQPGTISHDDYVRMEHDRMDGKVSNAVAWVHDHGLHDAEELRSLLLTVGRIPAVLLFFELGQLGLLPDDALVLVGEVWQMAEFPMRMADPDEWLWLFEEAGYHVDGVPAAKPLGTVTTLYRGAPAEHRLGMSWTGSREVAEWFATRNRESYRMDAQVWCAQVEGWRFLYRTNERKEDEYVIDTVGLEPSPMPE